MPEISPFVLYLIHIDAGDAGADHYLGITRRARLPLRIKEHKVGRGAARTKRARDEGRCFALAAIFPAWSFAEEATALKTWNLPARCPQCTTGLPTAADGVYSPYNPRGKPRVFIGRAAWGTRPNLTNST